jgi:hypothetical protein
MCVCNSCADSCHVEFENIVRKSSCELEKNYFFNHFKFNPNKNMNAKQTIPIVARLAPAIAVVAPPLLLVGGVAFFVWLLSDDKKKKSDTAPAATERKPLPIPSDTSGNSVENRGIPAEIPAKPAAAPVPAVIPSFSASVTAPQKIVAEVPPPPVIPAVKTAPRIPLPAQKKFITREDMAKIFNGGARALTRTGAVTALKSLGFGKTAAYDALLTDGRFSAWLQFAPDGIITWTDR